MAELDEIVLALRQLLSTQAVDAPPPADERDARRLDEDQSAVIMLADYAVSRFSNEEYRLSGELQFGFAGRSIAPTAMGNIAQSIPHYAYTRYGMNIDLFWTRLQKTMQSDDFYAVLQDAKTQLDFLVALVWLVGATLVVWLPLMALWSHDVRPFLVTAIAGAVALSGLYQLAVQNYRAFADLTRAAIDLFRLQLLKAMNVPPPASVATEAQLWTVLNRRMSYASTINISYERPK